MGIRSLIVKKHCDYPDGEYKIATVEDAEKYMGLAFKAQFAPLVVRTIEMYISHAEKLANHDNKTILEGLL